MTSKTELNAEIKSSKKFLKFLLSHGGDRNVIDELCGYIDGLTFALNGRLE